MPVFAFNCKQASNLREDWEEAAAAATAGLKIEVEKSQRDDLITKTATICHLCGAKVMGAALSWDGIKVIGALAVHL